MCQVFQQPGVVYSSDLKPRIARVFAHTDHKIIRSVRTSFVCPFGLLFSLHQYLGRQQAAGPGMVGLLSRFPFLARFLGALTRFWDSGVLTCLDPLLFASCSRIRSRKDVLGSSGAIYFLALTLKPRHPFRLPPCPHRLIGSCAERHHQQTRSPIYETTFQESPR